MTIFETDRLAVRRWTHDDAEALERIYGDPECVRFVGDGEPLSLEICHHWVDVTDANFERRGYGMMGACDKQTGELIACVGIVHPGQQEEPELKYALRRDAWGRGLATELAAGAMEYARTQLEKTRVIATVYSQHVRSQNVLSKVGFKHDLDRPNEDGTVTQVWVWTSTRA